MAKNKVEIDVKVDDKGTTKKLALDSKKAGEGLDDVAKNSRTADRNIKGVAQTSANSSKNFSKMAQGMGGLVGAYATFAASVFALSAAFQFLKNASDIAQLEASHVAYAQNTGVAMGSLTNQLRAASKGMLDFQSAAEASAIGLAKGFSSKQMNDIAAGALAVSNVLGRNFQDAFDRLVRGISKAEPELLDELGITLKLETATKNYAASLGVAADSLSTADKSQAVYLETMKQLANVTADQEGVANPFVQLGATFSDIAKSISSFILPPLRALASFLNDNAAAAFLFFGAIGTSIIKNMPFVDQMGTAMRGFFDSQIQKAADAKNALSAYNAKLEEIKQGVSATRAQGAAGVQAGASAAVGAGAESPVLQRAAEGKMKGADFSNLKKAMKGAENHYNEHGIVTKGIFKGMSIEIVRDMDKSFDKMKTKSTTTFGKIGQQVTKVKLGVQKLSATIKGGLAKAWLAVGKAAKVAGKAMNMAMKATVILGVIQMIYDMVMSLINAPKTVMEGIVGVAKGAVNLLQGFVNMYIGIINYAIQKINKIPGVDIALIEKRDFAREINEGLDAKLKASKTYQDAAAKQEANALKEAENEKLKSIKEGALAARDEMDKIMGGKVFDQTDKDFDINKAGLARAEAIKSLPVQQLFADAFSIKDADKRAEAIDAIKDKMKDIEQIAPKFAAAIQSGDKKAVDSMVSNATRFTKNVKGAKTALNEMGVQLKGASAVAVRIYAEDIRKMGNAAVEAGNEIGSTTDVIQQLDDAFKDKGGLDAYIAQLQELETRAAQLSGEEMMLKLNAMDNVGTPKLFQEQQKAEQDFAAKELANKQAILAFEQEAAALTSKMTPVELENHAKKLALLGQEIELTEKAKNVAEEQMNAVTRAGQKLGDTLSNSMARAFQGIIDGTMSAKQAFGSMAQSMLQMMAKLVAEALAMKALKFLFPAGSAFGDFLGIHNRYGGVMSDGKKVSGYSQGGIAKGRDGGYPAILHGTEAVVPLPNGRSIPVEMSGGGNQQNNVVVNVSTDGTTRTESSNGADSEQLGKAIAKAVQQELQNQKRSGGILSPYGVA